MFKKGDNVTIIQPNDYAGFGLLDRVDGVFVNATPNMKGIIVSRVSDHLACMVKIIGTEQSGDRGCLVLPYYESNLKYNGDIQLDFIMNLIK